MNIVLIILTSSAFTMSVASKATFSNDERLDISTGKQLAYNDLIYKYGELTKC